MDRTSHPVGPMNVDVVRHRFEAWRRTRKLNTRIPESLWSQAAQLARMNGVHPIARALHLEYNDLRHRMNALQETVKVQPAFVEVAACTVQPVSPESVVEMERPDGGRMRVRVTGQTTLLALTEAFWRCRA
jgi:hypothetical protein